MLPRTHGSALFTRGETQALVTVTAGHLRRRAASGLRRGRVETALHAALQLPAVLGGRGAFPARPRPPRDRPRRPRRTLAPAGDCPPRKSGPTRLRVVSDILESNGSSSMATICGGSLAMLMDAGVPLEAPVAGYRHGSGQGRRPLRGADRHRRRRGSPRRHGLQGRRAPAGITALQMDIKITGHHREIMSRALEQAREARVQILGKMNEALATHRERSRPTRRASSPSRSQGQDPRHHRARRQDDPLDHRAHRLQDRDPGRRPGGHRLTDEAAAQKAVRHHQGADGRGRTGQDLRGQGRARGQLRRVRRDPSRRRRTAAHLRDRRDRRINEVPTCSTRATRRCVKVIDIVAATAPSARSRERLTPLATFNSAQDLDPVPDLRLA